MKKILEVKKIKLGFIGQGYVGKTYADLFEKKGYDIVRYSLEEPYIKNKSKIRDCDIVFIAVNTPTRPTGFDDSAIREVLKYVGDGKVAVVRSTLVPGTTESLQKQFPKIFLMHTPEFLTARLAFEEAAQPKQTIIGIAKDNAEYREKAKIVLDILPASPHRSIVPAKEAEMIKYIQNNFLYVKNIYMSIVYKFAEEMGCDLTNICSALLANPMMGTYHHMDLETLNRVGYGAGGECLLKDFEAFIQLYKKENGEKSGEKILEAIRDRNLEMLKASGKDLKIIENIYGHL